MMQNFKTSLGLSQHFPFVLEICVNVQSPLWSGSSRALSMQTVIKVMNSPQLPRKGRHYQDKKNILRHLSWFAPPPSFYNSTLPELRTMLPFTELRKRKKNQGSVIYNWTSCILVNPLQWKETLKSFFTFEGARCREAGGGDSYEGPLQTCPPGCPSQPRLHRHSMAMDGDDNH